jgi:hypothetical protein
MRPNVIKVGNVVSINVQISERIALGPLLQGAAFLGDNGLLRVLAPGGGALTPHKETGQ